MRLVACAVVVMMLGCGSGGAPVVVVVGAGHGGGAASSSSSGGAGGEMGGAGGAGGGVGGVGGIAPPECVVPGDCPGVDNECRTRTCSAGVCGVEFANAGHHLAAQVAGDCATAICDGAGGVASMADPYDVADDGIECTVDACPGPTHTPKPKGTACSQSGGALCDGATCAKWIPVVCKSDSTSAVVQGCDGIGHNNKIANLAGQMFGCGNADDAPYYCAPGQTCTLALYQGPGSFTYQDGHCQ